MKNRAANLAGRIMSVRDDVPSTYVAHQAARLMLEVEDEYKDPRTGEVNCTALAEHVCYELDLGIYDEDFGSTCPGWVYDMAVECEQPTPIPRTTRSQ